MPKDNDWSAQEKLMCSLSLAAYAGILKTSPTDVQTDLNNMLEPLSQKLVWGPALHNPELPWFITRKCPDLERPDDAMMFITQKKDANGNSLNEYSVVIRGTNPISISAWISQDLDVYPPLYSWSSVLGIVESAPVAVPDDELPKVSAISKGAAKTVALACALQPETGIPGQGSTFFDFLKATLNPDSIVNFTGHSLGGLASPTLALWCVENGFVSKNNLYVYPFAGPTAGNAVFARHSDTVFNSNGDDKRCVRYPNTLDVVPKAFNHDDLESIKTIYAYLGVDTPKFFCDLVDDILDKVGYIYSQLEYTKTITGDFINILKFLDGNLITFIRFIVHLICQHVIPYLMASSLSSAEALRVLNDMIDASDFDDPDRDTLKKIFSNHLVGPQ